MTSYLFVDGACLRETVRRIANRYCAGAPLDLDYEQLTREFSKVFFYDALPGRRQGEAEVEYLSRTVTERELMDRLSFQDRIHVYEGEVRRSTARRGPEQKKVDVMITVDMLSHTFRRNMEQATLLTSDLDFRPLLDALVHEGMDVTLWYPPDATANDLIVSADRKRRLDVRSIYNMLSSNSKKAFELPQSGDMPSKGEYLPIVGRWAAPDGQYLLMKGKEFVLSSPSPNPSHVLYHQHVDLNILRFYMEDAFGIQVLSEEELMASLKGEGGVGTPAEA